MTDDAFCAHAYTIISSDKKYKLIGVAPVDCDEDDADSTRAEKSGILTIVTVVQALEELKGCISSKIVLYCDNSQEISCTKVPYALL